MLAGNQIGGEPLVDQDDGDAMFRRSIPVAAVLLLSFVVLLPVRARAADTCFTDSASLTLVAKGFKLPSRNKCTPVQGQVYSFANASMEPWVFTGAACTNAAGNMLRLNYSFYVYVDGFAYKWGHMDIPLPAKKGGNASESEAANPNGESKIGGGAAIVTCEPPTIPLP